MYFPVISQEDLVLDSKGKIIPGAKIEFLDPVSTNLIPVYVYDTNPEGYTVVNNPIQLNILSRPSQTYFTDRLTLCRAYKYRGNFSDPVTDDDSNNWELVREWLAGQTVETVNNDTVVTGISALRQANTELGTVTVVGYHTQSDCGARTYTWFEGSNDTEDGGYVIKANGKESGRWILNFDGEYIPSSYYGVYPGQEANMNNLLNFPSQVWRTGCAKGIYFLPGHYISTSAKTTTKKVLIDNSTEFDASSFTVGTLDVIGTAYQPIGNFATFYNDTVHSGWFKNINYFWNSSAKNLIVDDVNYQDLQNGKLGTITVSDKIISGKGVVAGRYSGSMTVFDNCQITGEVLNPNEKYTFKNMKFTDRYFESLTPENINDNIVVDSSCYINPDDFKNTMNFIVAAKIAGIKEIDLKECYVTVSFENDYFTTVRNGKFINGLTPKISSNYIGSYINNLTFVNTVIDVNFHDCEINVAQLASQVPHGTYSFNKSYIDFRGVGLASSEKSQITCSWTFKDCNIYRFRVDTPSATQDDDGYIKPITMTDCTLDTCQLKVCKLWLAGCNVNNSVIEIRPYRTGLYMYNESTLRHWLVATFIGNKFNGETPVKFTTEKQYSYGNYGLDNCIAQIVINDNSFYGNATGIEIPFYNPQRIDEKAKFIADSEYLNKYGLSHSWSYKGNTGLCPAGSFKGIRYDSWELNKPEEVNGINVSSWTSKYTIFNLCSDDFIDAYVNPATLIIGTEFGKTSLNDISSEIVGVNDAVLSEVNDNSMFAIRFPVVYQNQDGDVVRYYVSML